MLIVSRIICAIGASELLVVAFALVRDLFSGPKSARMFSLLNGAIGISPTFAPVIGGYLAAACLGLMQFIMSAIAASILLLFPVTSSLSFAIAIIISIIAIANAVLIR